jgi:hypothetical protein
MRPIFPIITALLFTVFLACERNETKEALTSDVNLNMNKSAFSEAMDNRAGNASDPFVLHGIEIEGNKIKITVSYSGGCKTHVFTVILSDSINPENPALDMVILHDANDDNCEAYITETIEIEIDSLSELISEALPGSVNAYNGSDPNDEVEMDLPTYEFSFTESDTCSVYVTAQEVICGNGLYDNLWFALDSKTSAGIPGYYYNNYLRPVAISSSLSNFTPEKGKRYKIGARITTVDPFANEPVCLAYAGPSISVKIMCITAVD